MYNLISIGIDQSYTKTGIGISADGKLLKVKSIPFRGCKNNSEKRKYLSYILNHIIQKNIQKGSEMVIICERIRTFSQGHISMNYIKSTGALIAIIIDTAYEYNIPVYSVDTRSWKSKIIGTSKGGKEVALNYIKSLGFDIGKDDDAADAGCISLYAFLPKKQQNLKRET